MFLLSLSVVQVQVLIFDNSDTAWAGGDIIAAFQNNHVITTYPGLASRLIFVKTSKVQWLINQ